jgi:hypothetical protein
MSETVIFIEQDKIYETFYEKIIRHKNGVIFVYNSYYNSIDNKIFILSSIKCSILTLFSYLNLFNIFKKKEYEVIKDTINEKNILIDYKVDGNTYSNLIKLKKNNLINIYSSFELDALGNKTKILTTLIKKLAGPNGDFNVPITPDDLGYNGVMITIINNETLDFQSFVFTQHQKIILT